MTEKVIANGQRSHGLNHWNRAGQDTGVVASTRFELDILKVGRDGFLGVKDGGCGFECDTKEDVLSVGDTALNPSRSIGGGPNFSIAHSKGVIVGPSSEKGTPKA